MVNKNEYLKAFCHTEHQVGTISDNNIVKIGLYNFMLFKKTRRYFLEGSKNFDGSKILYLHDYSEKDFKKYFLSEQQYREAKLARLNNPLNWNF